MRLLADKALPFPCLASTQVNLPGHTLNGCSCIVDISCLQESDFHPAQTEPVLSKKTSHCENQERHYPDRTLKLQP